MKIILLSLFCISSMVFAQKKDSLSFKKRDTLKVKTRKEIKVKQHENMGTMPVAKPKDTIYSSLKAPKKQHPEYKILNSTPPEKQREK